MISCAEHLVIDKPETGFERIDFNFKSCSKVVTFEQSTGHAIETFHEKKSQLMQQNSLLPYFKKLP